MNVIMTMSRDIWRRRRPDGVILYAAMTHYYEVKEAQLCWKSGERCSRMLHHRLLWLGTRNAKNQYLSFLKESGCFLYQCGKRKTEGKICQKYGKRLPGRQLLAVYLAMIHTSNERLRMKQFSRDTARQGSACHFMSQEGLVSIFSTVPAFGRQSDVESHSLDLKTERTVSNKAYFIRCCDHAEEYDAGKQVGYL